ncbi:FIG005080: Possible exported protein [uncultured Candidatus Thioglobus sp.]|nr:FIG005080: Possible exported protein [uncultured Candidatus Thioglobus sp.]
MPRILYNFILYAFAAILLLITIVIITIRLTLTMVGNDHAKMQHLVSERIEHPIEAERIHASWDGWLFNVGLYKVGILDLTQNLQFAQFDSVLVNINILQSLYKQEIIFDSIIISGADLTIKKQQKNTPVISIKRYLADNLPYQKINGSPIVAWLLSQKNIVIENSKITLIDLQDTDDPLLLTNTKLSMHNNGYRTQINGTATLPALYGDILNFSIDVTGDLLSPSWSAVMYLASQDMKIAGLLKEFDYVDIEGYQGRGDIALWSTWNNATLRKLEGKIKLDNLKLHNNQAEVFIQQMMGYFLVTKRIDQGFDLSLSLESFSTEHGNWPKSKISLQKIQLEDKQNEYKYLLNASYINLEDMHDLINVIPNFAHDFPLKNDFHLTGTLKNSVIKYFPALPNSKQFYIDSEFLDVMVQHHNPPIMLTGLSGQITGMPQAGRLSLSTSATKIDLSEFFTQPMLFSGLNAELNWRTQNNEFLLSANPLNVYNEDINMTLQGNLKFTQNNKLPFADISLAIKDGKVNKIVNYLPKSLPKRLRTWLERSLISGNIPTAQLTLTGWLENYPFDNNQGTFNGFAKIDQGTLHFPKWIKITNIHADLEITEDTLTINAHSGDILAAKIKKATAVIQDIAYPDVRKSVVINMEIDGGLNDGVQFINNSPLQISPILKNLLSQKISGDMGLVLDLDIPLNAKRKAGELLFNGSLSVLHGTLEYKDILDITLTELSGLIDFSQNSIATKSIKGDYAGYPIDLRIEKQDKTTSKITLQGIADAQFISTQLLYYLPEISPWHLGIEKHITGSSAWEASLFTQKEDGHLNKSKQLIIKSNLEGLAINLPAPMQKEAASIIPLELSINFLEQEEQNIQIQYGDIANSLLFDIKAIENKQNIPPTISFDNKNIPSSYKQLTITGNIENLMALEWLHFITEQSSDMEDMQKYSVSLDIHTNSMNLLDKTFSDVAIRLDDMYSMYHLNIDAADINGDAYISQVDNEETIQIKINKLHLIPNKSDTNIEKQSYQAIPQQIPPLNVDILELIYHNINLGEMHFSTAKKDNGLAINNIHVQNEYLDITGDGAWNAIHDAHVSKFDLAVTVESMQSLLEELGYKKTVIEGNHAQLSIDVGWEGPPTDFSLNHMEGDLKLSIKQGQLIDVNRTTNRLLGLLNINTLPKRLLLDFSDVFGEGIAFHAIDGHFKVSNGQASIDNFLISGYSVDIHFSGTTDIVAKTYDQVITIIPKISDSIPLAGALLGGPIGIGVGATIFLAKGIFQFVPNEIDSMLLKQYRLTGDWDNPQVTQIPHPFTTQDTRSISDWSPKIQLERK